MSRWNDGLLLDAPGILVAASDPGYTWMAMQNDGSTFVAILARPASAAGGTIIDAAHIAHVDGEWRMRVSPFVATTERVVALRLLREGDHYLAHWSEVGAGVFASRLSFDGYSLDGDDTSWRGWPIADVDSSQPFTFDGTRTWFIGNGAAGARVYQLSGRTATPLFPLSAGTTTSIACVPTGGCVLASAPAVVYYPPFPKDPARVTLQVIRPGRRRSVGR